MIGEIFGDRYQIIRLLGEGGMGGVYEALDTDSGSNVAVKVIRVDTQSKDTGPVLRFEREAKIAGSIDTNHIVRVLDVGKDETTGVLFMVMERLVGEDLRQTLARLDLLTPDLAMRVAAQVCAGLVRAHEAGVVHRDIKPANIFLSRQADGEIIVKILDFGIAKIKKGHAYADHSNPLTATGDLLGSPPYMSPEQARGLNDIDFRSDIWSIGVVLYRALSGRTPHEHVKAFGDLIIATCSTPPRPIQDIAPWVPPEMAAVVHAALQLDPADRYASAAVMLDAIMPLLSKGSGIQKDMLVALDRLERTTVAPKLVIPGRSSRPGLSFGQSTGLGLETTLSRSSVIQSETWVGRPPSHVLGFRRAFLGLGVLAILAGVVFAIRGGKDADKPIAPITSPTVAPPLPPIKVGILHSLQGTMAISERPVMDATLLAIDEVNERGGLLNRQVEAVTGDGKSDDATFAREAERLITHEKVVTVFGAWTSSSRKTLAPVFERFDHLLVYPVQHEGLEDSPFILYTGATPNQQVTPAVSFCVEKLGHKRFFLVGSDYVFPRAVSEVIRDHVKVLKGEVVGERFVLLSDTNFAPVIKAIRAASPDVILNMVNGDSNVAFFRALRADGITPQKIPTVSFSIAENELTHLADVSMAGDYLAWNYFQSVDRAENKVFIERFKAKYGASRAVTDPMESAYTGVHLWARAVTAAGTDDPRAIRRALKGQSFGAPSGLVRVDPSNNHTWKVFRMGRIAAGNTVEIVANSEAALEPVPFANSRTRAQWEAFLDHLFKNWNGSWANPQKPDLLK